MTNRILLRVDRFPAPNYAGRKHLRKLFAPVRDPVHQSLEQFRQRCRHRHKPAPVSDRIAVSGPAAADASMQIECAALWSRNRRSEADAQNQKQGSFPAPPDYANSPATLLQGDECRLVLLSGLCARTTETASNPPSKIRRLISAQFLVQRDRSQIHRHSCRTG